MRVIVIFFLTMAWGFLGHLTRPYMVERFTDGRRRFDGWFAILSYSIGVLMALFAFIVQLYLLAERFIENKQETIDVWDVSLLGFVAFILSFFPMGVGTVLGHWFLPDDCP